VVLCVRKNGILHRVKRRRHRDTQRRICKKPGLLESAYEKCLAYELRELGLKIELQKAVPVVYKNIKLDCGYRIDILVEDKVIIELKSIDALNPVHEAQILTYMKFADKSTGLLINLPLWFSV